MRCVLAAFIVFGSVLALQPSGTFAENALDLEKRSSRTKRRQLCPQVTPDPFTGFGPDEWAKPSSPQGPSP